MKHGSLYIQEGYEAYVQYQLNQQTFMRFSRAAALLLFLCVLFASLILSGCASKSQTSDQIISIEEAQLPANPSPLKIGVLKIADSLPLYWGVEQKLFEKAGIPVELVSFSSAADQSKALEAKEIDGLMTDLIVQSLIQKSGTEMRTLSLALGATPADGRFIVASSPNNSELTVKDLSGKQVGIAQGTMMEYLLDSYAQDLGVDPGSINKVSIPSLSLRLESLLANQLDAAVLPDPLAQLAQAQGCVALVDDTQLPKNYSQSVISLRQEVIQSRPAELLAFIKGLKASMDDLNAKVHTDRDHIMSLITIPQPIRGSWAAPKFSFGALPGEEEVSRVERWMVDRGLLKEAYSYTQMVDERFVKAAKDNA